MSAILIKCIERAIVRLSTPSTLSSGDRDTLDALLDLDEKLEVHRLFEGFNSMRCAMAFMFMLTPEYEQISKEIEGLGVDLYWARRTRNGHLRVIEQKKSLLSKNPRNPHVREPLERHLFAHTQMAQGYLDQMVGYFDAMSDFAKRHFRPFERPISDPDVFRRVPDIYLVLWPDWITPLQDAYREVLMKKLERLLSLKS